MASAALARLTQLLDSKKLAGTVSRPFDTSRLVTSTGIDSLDAQLAGGWPQGQLSDVAGPVSSGRTALMVSTFARVTQQGGVVALVDSADRFDARSAAAAGVVLDRMLWVRGAQRSSAAAPESGRPWGRGVIALDDRVVHTAIRAFDLIVRAGGFAVVVCDLADMPARSVRALPPATWLRLAHVLEGQSTVGVLVGAHPIGRSAGGVSVTLRARGEWAGHSGQSRRLAGLAVTPSVTQRQRKGAGPSHVPEGASCSFVLSAIQ